MWGALVFIVGVFLLSDGSDDAPVVEQTAAVTSGAGVDLASGYDVYSFRTPTPIPDGDRAGVVAGPIRIPDDGAAVEGVILSISITHHYTGDLDLRLGYDEDNDGIAEASAALEPHRARPGGWAVREPFACPAEMNGVFYYRDDAPGEYDERGDASFSVFDGLAKGGCFMLSAVDSLAEDTGTLLGWTVFLKHSPAKVVRHALAG